MKKIALILGAVVVSTGLFAQKANIKNANNELYQEPVNYDKAIAYIDLAKENPETAELSDTWYTAGRIGYDMAYKEMSKLYIQQQPNYDAMRKGLDMMFTNYMVADKYDSYLDKKGRVKYNNRKKMVADFKEMHDLYINAGVDAGDQNRDYNTAYTLLSEYLQIADSEMFGDKPIKVDSTYNEIKYYAAFYARRAEKEDEALKLLEELKPIKNKNSAFVFQTLSEIYMAKEDTVKAEATLEEAVAMFPADANVIGSLVNHYMMVGKSEKAVENLEKLVNSDPSNVQYKVVKASVLAIQMKDFAKAKETLQPMFDDGSAAKDASILFEMGRIWALDGMTQLEKADEIENDKEYKKAVDEAKKCFSKALEYYEPSRAIMAKDDVNYETLLQSIREMYVRLGQTSSDAYKAVNEELKSL
jgi:tetratricopeptide (TPR) repeat protein